MPIKQPDPDKGEDIATLKEAQKIAEDARTKMLQEPEPEPEPEPIFEEEYFDSSGEKVSYTKPTPRYGEEDSIEEDLYNRLSEEGYIIKNTDGTWSYKDSAFDPPARHKNTGKEGSKILYVVESPSQKTIRAVEPRPPAAMGSPEPYQSSEFESLTEEQKRITELSNSAKEMAFQMVSNVDNDVDESVPNGPIWYSVTEEGSTIHVNPFGIHEMTKEQEIEPT